jgi:uncharacterized membrane protein YfcA
MCAVWASLNSFLIVVFAFNGRINPASLELTAYLFPMLPVGVFLGERLHGCLNERHFRIFVYSLLLISGVALLF